jgi:hypothetical protein
LRFFSDRFEVFFLAIGNLFPLVLAQADNDCGDSLKPLERAKLCELQRFYNFSRPSSMHSGGKQKTFRAKNR